MGLREPDEQLRNIISKFVTDFRRAKTDEKKGTLLRDFLDTLVRLGYKK